MERKTSVGFKFCSFDENTKSESFSKTEQPIYGYSLWLDYNHTTPFYSFIGHLGQYIAVIPKYNMVIVRVGKIRDRRNTKNGVLPGNDLYYYVDESVKMSAEN